MAPAEAARLGILMLDTRFPRIAGDVGNPASWEFPVAFAVVPGATPQAVVREDTARFVDAFVAEGQRLVSRGCTGIATTCGFLALIRPQLATRLGVPVAASALEQAAQIRATLGPDRSVGILTICKDSLTPAHLAAAGVPPGSHVVGVEDTSFARTILGNEPTLDVTRARAEMLDAAQRLIAEAPETGAILLECTNMVPYAADVATACGRPVYSIHTYLTWFHQSLAPRTFGPLLDIATA